MNPNAAVFGLIRHAPTLSNEQRLIQGQRESPLSPAGEDMAATWGRQLAALGWQRILASDLGRARSTAALINVSLRLPLHIDSRLREQHWGTWTGKTLAGLRAESDQLAREERAGWEFRPPNGESRREVLARTLTALQEAARSWPGNRVLVICHEGVLKGLLYHLSGRGYLPEEPVLHGKRHLHLIRIDEGRLSLASLNHLQLAGAGT